jgi:ABC-type Zn uptake system ZnuABC Zn-binding protein ZnuA
VTALRTQPFGRRLARGSARAVATIASVLVVTAALTGCSAKAPATTLTVVATTTQVTDFTKQIVGNAGTVTGLIQPNQSAHSFDPSAAQLLALTKANAVVISGAGLEPWLANLLKAANFTGTVIDASAGIPLIEDDPHIWTDPANAQKMVANIAAGLDEVSAVNAAIVNSNAAAYEAKLTVLNDWAMASFAHVPTAQRLLVTNHDAFTYFVAAFGIDFVGSIIPGFDDNAEPSAARIDRVISEIKASGATAIFSEASISPKLAQTIATEAHVKVYSGDDALYSDSLGASGSAGQTYISATVHNVTTLIQAWGYQPLPLPAELRS